MLGIDAVQNGLRMTLRSFVPAAVALAGLLGCYVSHAEFSDASPPPADDGRDDAGRHDDAGADLPTGLCTGDDIIGATELIARRSEFDGRFVRVRGVVAEYGPRGCTHEPCAPDAPCCNACSVSVLLAGTDGGGPVIAGTGAGIPGCYGDECHLACTPYDVGRSYVLRGTFGLDPSPPGAILTVMGAPGDVCEDSPPPDHRGSYRVVARSSSLEGECERWAPMVGSTGFLFASVGDPGQLELWQSMVAPPGPGRFAGTIAADGSRADLAAAIHWSCCDHSFVGYFPDSRSVEAWLTIEEGGHPECRGRFELVGMREDVPCADTYEAAACFGAGGIYAYAGPDSGEVCSCPTYDGLEACAEDADCESACLVEAPGPTRECSAVTRGRCTRGYRWAGCYCWLEHGPTATETCWD